MATRGRGARLKGSNFEREIAHLLTDILGVTFKRGLGQARAGGSEHPDVYSEEIPWLHIECKNQKICNIKKAMLQAITDSKKLNAMPVVVSKDTGKDILVTMRIDDWIGFLAAAYHANKD